MIKISVFEKVTDAKGVFVGNTDCTTAAVSGAPITIKGRWCLKCKKHNVACGS